MGQCPMTPPSFEDDERSVLSAASSSASHSAFLVEHKFDAPERSILSPDEVIASFEYQELVNARFSKWRQQRKREKSFDVDDGMVAEVTTITESVALSDDAVPQVNLSVMSEAPTDTTRKISNIDRIAPKQKFRARANANRASSGVDSNIGSIAEQGSGDEKSLRGMTSFCSDTSFVDHESNENDVDPIIRNQGNKGGILSKYQQKYQSHLTNDEQSVDLRKQDHVKVGGETRCLNPILPPLCLNGAYGMDIRGRQEVSSAIHLKMEAHLVHFYQNYFLRAFPDSPQPKGMVLVPSPGKKGRDKTPNLVPSGSESTTATPDSVQSNNLSFSPVKFALDDSPFLDLALSGSLGLVNGAQQTSNRRNYLILMNEKTGAPLAVCALKSPHGSPVVRIYTIKPRVKGQKSAATTKDVGLSGAAVPSMPLYAWAEFATEGEFPLPVRYSMYMSTGVEGKFEKEPSYKGSHPTPGSPEIVVVGRTGSERIYRGCCLLSVHSDESNNAREPYFRLSVSRGIDPALFICFAAIVDETVESTMRKKCDARARNAREKPKKQKQSKSPSGVGVGEVSKRSEKYGDLNR